MVGFEPGSSGIKKGCSTNCATNIVQTHFVTYSRSYCRAPSNAESNLLLRFNISKYLRLNQEGMCCELEEFVKSVKKNYNTLMRDDFKFEDKPCSPNTGTSGNYPTVDLLMANA